MKRFLNKILSPVNLICEFLSFSKVFVYTSLLLLVLTITNVYAGIGDGTISGIISGGDHECEQISNGTIKDGANVLVTNDYTASAIYKNFSITDSNVEIKQSRCGINIYTIGDGNISGSTVRMSSLTSVGYLYYKNDGTKLDYPIYYDTIAKKVYYWEGGIPNTTKIDVDREITFSATWADGICVGSGRTLTIENSYVEISTIGVWGISGSPSISGGTLRIYNCGFDTKDLGYQYYTVYKNSGTPSMYGMIGGKIKDDAYVEVFNNNGVGIASVKFGTPEGSGIGVPTVISKNNKGVGIQGSIIYEGLFTIEGNSGGTYNNTIYGGTFNITNKNALSRQKIYGGTITINALENEKYETYYKRSDGTGIYGSTIDGGTISMDG
ncbi:hypothetical protein, partial [Candidatus Ruminimicrobium bovinum]|uniref:hypothetical protein n=1 Tax=Candidatus Ruminimicrobium bovinum TaxID=3242779 RepID=UPI0039B97FA4